METANQGQRQPYYGVCIVIRDFLVFLSLLACVAVLYRIAPSMFHGTVSDPMTIQTTEAALQESDPGVLTMVQPVVKITASEAPPQSHSGGTAPASDQLDMAAALHQAAPATASAKAPIASAAGEAVLSQPTSPGDFTAAFPSIDTGEGALHSFQSDETRIAINKVAENGVTYFIADVWVKNISAFKTALAKGEYGRNIHEMPTKIAADNGTMFAVSGDYYGARDKGIVVRNGKLYRDVMNEDVCLLHYDGTLDTYRASDFSTLQSLDETVWQAWAFGPVLVKDGAACDTSSSKIKVKNPRCAIGFYEPGHYCFIVVDGRQNGYSSGMTLSELSDVFVRLGCKAAYNLDGGATAIMVFDGQVVNHPTKGGRASSDIICF